MGELQVRLAKAKDEVSARTAWAELLPAIDELLSQPDIFDLSTDALPLTLHVNSPNLRVFVLEGDIQQLPKAADRVNAWVVWRDAKGVASSQALYRSGSGGVTARAYADNLLLFVEYPSRVEAWSLRGAQWRQNPELVKEIGAVGYWLMLENGKKGKPERGEPHLCPDFVPIIGLCQKLELKNGKPVLVAVDPAMWNRISQPEAIRANIKASSVGSVSPGGTPESQEGASLAAKGLARYLERPVTEQMAPAAFRTFFGETITLTELAPNIRVYKLTVHPEYQPKTYAWVQWWDNPAKSSVQPLGLEHWDTLYEAMLAGSAREPVLVYSSGTFPTRHNTSRNVTVLRLDSGNRQWVLDSRAFTGSLPAALGKLKLSYGNGSNMSMYFPDQPPMRNEIDLDPAGLSLSVCETQSKDRCITFRYKGTGFVFQP